MRGLNTQRIVHLKQYMHLIPLCQSLNYCLSVFPFRPVPFRLCTIPENRRVFTGEVTSATVLPEIGATIPGARTMSGEQ